MLDRQNEHQKRTIVRKCRTDFAGPTEGDGSCGTGNIKPNSGKSQMESE